MCNFSVNPQKLTPQLWALRKCFTHASGKLSTKSSWECMHNNQSYKTLQYFSTPITLTKNSLGHPSTTWGWHFFIHTSAKKAYAKRTVIFFDKVSEIIIICIIERITGPGFSVCDIFFVPVTLPVSDVFWTFYSLNSFTFNNMR